MMPQNSTAPWLGDQGAAENHGARQAAVYGHNSIISCPPPSRRKAALAQALGRGVLWVWPGMRGA
jgi:hypothetical protein